MSNDDRHQQRLNPEINQHFADRREPELPSNWNAYSPQRRQKSEAKLNLIVEISLLHFKRRR